MNLELLMQNAHRDHVGGDGARPSTEDDRIVDALRNPPVIPNEDKARIVELATGLLLETPSNKVRNAAAMFLTDLIGQDATVSIVRVLRRPGIAKSAGSLLFALNDVEATLPLGLIVNMIEQGSLEAQGEALTFMEESRVDPFDGEQHDAAKAQLSKLLNDRDKSSIAHAAEIALEYLLSLRPEFE